MDNHNVGQAPCNLMDFWCKHDFSK